MIHLSKTLISALLATCLILPSFSASAQPKTQAQKYAEKLDSSEPFNMAIWGMFAMKANGDTLANVSSFRKMTPASNTKLISTGLAMYKLGADYRFETKIGYSGSVSEGVLNGDIYIIGGGDPTIASSDSIATPINDLFAQWKGFLLKSGITRVNGRIIGDGRFFEGPIENDCWQIGDMGFYYGVGGNGLCFFENEQDFTVKPGTHIGDPVSVKPKYPETPWMEYNNTCTTGAAGVGDALMYFTSDNAARGSMKGELGIESGTRTEECSNKFGAFTCAYYFYNFLKSNGVLVTDGPADIDEQGNIRTDLQTMEFDRQAAEVANLKIIGSTFSPTLEKIVNETNHRSDNFYAETCMRILAKTLKGKADYATCVEVEMELFKELGVKNPDKGVFISDGSGLSRQNYISPDFFVRYLTAMTKTPVYSQFVKTLPSPGTNGTLKNRMSSADPATKARVFMKTGSMNGVKCYSGYILPKSGKMEDTIIFSLLTNNLVEESVYPKMDQIVTYLSKEN